MKKIFVTGLLAVSMALVIATGAFSAQGDPLTNGVLRFMIGQKHYLVDKNTTEMDAAPYIKSGRTFVPVRFLGDGLSAATDYTTDGTVTVTKGDKLVTLKIGSGQLKIGNAQSWMDVAPEIKEGRTYLPARFVAEAFGYHVDWDADTETVRVFPDGVVLKPEIVYQLEKFLGAEMTYYVDSMDSKYNHWKYGSKKDNFDVGYDNDGDIYIRVFEHAKEEDIQKSFAVMRGLYPNNPEIVQKMQSILGKKRQKNDYDEKWKIKVNNRSVHVNTFWNDNTVLYSVMVLKDDK
ncbi:copper amine oxidase domain protein [Desulforamulus reducens MI-1]|uniref:Copper amine oxidase domain protein n=1 Tax=Desulforamulus reducens (strain ATCC BAA-1160 / DSM 100696 / MI-1) TaxID=349161 RepID=A4J2Q3_DESRM|nr:copper amine oxidase N-terminal domain-containing protein [Desulforamulus reducens]ABO49356.1 copper amine oxidase domain protein [Desulforamulus reducens MI-1]